MSEKPQEPTQTCEGWYVLHQILHIDWTRWQAQTAADRAAIADEAVVLFQSQAACTKGDSAHYSLIGHKGDLLLIHYRSTADDLNRLELVMAQSRLHAFLTASYSHLSIIEASLAEAAAMAAKMLAEKGLDPAAPGYGQALEAELAVQRLRLESRLFPVIPTTRYACFYPMSKRRGETANWYTLDAEARRSLMRGHGRIGHRYHQQVSQVISGSIGFDDWEWGVTLHGDDPLVFKKLVTEMRFDPVSARYADFGPFHLGIRLRPGGIAGLLEGRLD